MSRRTYSDTAPRKPGDVPVGVVITVSGDVLTLYYSEEPNTP